MNTLLVLGPAGTFSHQAGLQAQAMLAKARHGHLHIEFCTSLQEILERTARGDGFGILPIENNTAGTVKGGGDAFREFFKRKEVFVAGGVVLPVQHYLMTLPAVERIEDVTRVYSHAQPFLQCQNSLRRLKLNHRKAVSSTAEAALLLQTGAVDPTAAVLGPKLLAETYGLRIVKSNLEDKRYNATRFLILSNNPALKLPLTIGLIGINGKYATRISREAAARGISVIGSDIGTVLNNRMVVEMSNVVVFSTTLNSIVDVIRRMVPFSRPDQLWVDVASLKVDTVQAMMDSKAEVVGLHPMISPTASSFQGQTMFVHEARLDQWKGLFHLFLGLYNFKVKRGVPEEHDLTMSVVQGLCHAIILIMAMTIKRLRVDLDESMQYASPFYRIVLSLIGRILSHDLELYADIQMLNPHTERMLRVLEQETVRFRRIVGSKRKDRFVDRFQNIRRHFGSRHIRQATVLFDEVISLQTELKATHAIEVRPSGDRSGLLHEVTGVFAKHAINLSVQRARHTTKGGHYFIIGGYELPNSSSTIQKVMAEIRTIPDIESVTEWKPA